MTGTLCYRGPDGSRRTPAVHPLCGPAPPPQLLPHLVLLLCLRLLLRPWAGRGPAALRQPLPGVQQPVGGPGGAGPRPGGGGGRVSLAPQPRQPGSLWDVRVHVLRSSQQAHRPDAAQRQHRAPEWVKRASGQLRTFLCCGDSTMESFWLVLSQNPL